MSAVGTRALKRIVCLALSNFAPMMNVALDSDRFIHLPIQTRPAWHERF
jgi:hypothetical protein